MASQSTIEWTEASWNPITGCSKISPGCAHCYAERLARRLKAMGQPNYRNGFRVTCHEHALEIPLGWRKPQMVFVNSMSDLFHEKVPVAFIRKIFKTMRKARRHIFQVLTKRSARLVRLEAKIDWPDNVWMGVSVEDEDHTFRIDDLRATGAHVKFLSLEPLLGPIPELNLREIGWVIVGGESGPGARPMKKEWVVDIRDQCARVDVPFFFKQWGGVNKKQAGRLLDNRTYDEMPDEAEHVTPQAPKLFG